jgi:hypothetical protein
MKPCAFARMHPGARSVSFQNPVFFEGLFTAVLTLEVGLEGFGLETVARVFGFS